MDHVTLHETATVYVRVMTEDLFSQHIITQQHLKTAVKIPTAHNITNRHQTELTAVQFTVGNAPNSFLSAAITSSGHQVSLPPRLSLRFSRVFFVFCFLLYFYVLC